MLNIVTLCTGNVARSVMLGYMLTTLDESMGDGWHLRTAGTHVTEGAAMSGRTREALSKIHEIGEHRYGAHRSRQLILRDVEWADVILAAELDNVKFVQKHFIPYAEKVVQLAQFVHFAPLEGSFASKLHAVTAHVAKAEFDVVDPAGGDQMTYDACAQQLWELAQAFALIVGDERVD